MRIVPLIRAEFARLTASTLGKLSLAAIMIVPIVYGGLYLWGNQDPYSNLDKIPAALVVSDAGTTVDKKAVNYGEDAAKSLLDDGTFGWVEVTAAEAATGVTDGTYDFAIAFPSSFSADLASAADDDATQAQLVLTTNDTNSYLSTTLAKQAAATVRTSIATEVGETATDTLLSAVSDIRDGFVDASDGATKLADGATDAASGASKLADGTATLAAGAATLRSGTTKLADGADSLATGTKSLATGTKKLSTGATKLKTGLKTLDTSTAKLPASAKTLASGASTVATGAATAATGASQLETGTGQLATLAPTVQAQVKQVMAAYGVPAATAAGINAELQALTTGTATVDTSVGTLSNGLDALSSGAGQVATGTQTLSDSAPALAAGVHSAATGATTLATGAKDAASGAKKLSTGAATLADGAADAASGASDLADGASSVNDGAQSLSTGAGDLSTGATKLSTSLADGLDDIPATTADSRADTAAAVADPLVLDQKAITEASNYGAGLAPFFISLSSWIGIYALFLLVRPLSRRALTAVRRPVRTMIAGWATPAILGAVQMIALFAVVTLALHLQVANGLGLVLFMVLVAITFAAIVLALNVLFGSVGQFLGLILMIIQLVTAGGTFPWQTLPGPLAALHYALPMGHAVDGVRQLMYGGSGAAVWDASWPLLLWLAGGLIAATLGAAKQGRFRTLRELRPSAIGG